MDGINDFVNVAVRVRPLMKNDVQSNLKVFHDYPSALCVLDRQQTYSFDNIFDETANQITVFSTTIKPMIDKLLLGYNCTVFAYGQTGTGKTYTMGDPRKIMDDDMGMISMTFRELFENVNENLEIDVEVSLYEIYNEKVYDLLGDTKVALPVKGFSVHGLNRKLIMDLATAEDLLYTAGKNRHTAGTRQNANSSRSHAIYTLYCSVRSNDTVTHSKFNFVDLAGSESVRKTGNEGQQFFEGVNINKGLLCIGQVISALSSKKNYIPYRQSIITTLLQDSLNRTNTVTLIACVSANPSDSTETIQTLEFAKNAKKVVSRPEISAAVNQYLKMNPHLSTVKKKPAPNTPRFVTPMKRALSFQTSTVVKRPLHSTLIEEATASDQNALVRRFSPSGFNISGVSSIQEPPQINYSPIVRKCVDLLENTLLSKIDLLIKENTKHLLRRSERISKNLCSGCDATSLKGDENPNLENTKIIVIKSPTQSPPVSRALRDITPNDNQTLTKSMAGNSKGDSGRPQSTPQRTPVFKIPHVALQRLSPEFLIQKTSSPMLPNDAQPFSPGSILSESDLPNFLSKQPERVQLRRSTRLSIQPRRYYSESTVNDVTRATKRRSTVKVENAVPTKKKAQPRKTQHGEGDNPRLPHHGNILKLLNTGTAKKLQSLHTIGEKTAKQIVLYRDLRGEFNELKDLKNVLYKGRSYDRFIQANFLA